ncbi:AAA family ATPase [Flavobacterium davisii]|uniref:AAA family ATPase n=1 Tax=Flavobacterium columnare TaxID=996 RepID=A0A8G0KV55_9FLAO|nr:AAA family ATPase [Flavobacterium davisii]QYS89037.1 AAA family ATPase [Flavobacterium davisii]
MKSQVIYKNIFIYSQEKNTSFFTDFSEKINIIHGRNTSGKSTLIQAIHYTFGINDEKHKLTEILNENVIFRLDFILKKNKMKILQLFEIMIFSILKEKINL